MGVYSPLRLTCARNLWATVVLCLLAGAVYAGPLSDSAVRLADAAADQAPATPPRISVAWYAAPIVANLADAITTDIAIHSNRGQEGNVLLSGIAQHRAALYGFKIGLGVASALVVRSLDAHGHHKAAKIVSIIGTAPPAALAVNNGLILPGVH